MPYIKKKDHSQMTISSWDMMVDPESEVRVIEAFVDGLTDETFLFKKPADEGRPSYNPRDLLKLLIYGYRNQIRSSRKLANAAKTNIEVKWLLGDLEPDFRTISDFRKDNVTQLKNVFREFNRKIEGAVTWGYCSIDGSKFQACNSKDNNFTKNKLDDRITYLDARIEQYMNALETMDQVDENEETMNESEIAFLQEKLAEAMKRREKYKGYQKQMEETGVSQLSLVDADSKLMKNKNGFGMAYNVQTAVDSETHIIKDYLMTNQVTDHGLIAPTMEELRKNQPDGVMEVVADKGYNEAKDMLTCLEEGIIPHVIPEDKKGGCDFEIPYEEAEELDPTSTNPEEIRKCLHNGVVPEAYRDVISKVEIKEVRRKEVVEPQEEEEEPQGIYGTPETMKARARQGYFVRDPEANQVYCPMGHILRQKCVKKDGAIRYANKLACKKCPNQHRCFRSNGHYPWKEVDFTKDRLEMPCRLWPPLDAGGLPINVIERRPRKQQKYKMPKKKVVQFHFKPDMIKTDNRKCLSEHPFGSIKRWMGASYFLLRRKEKVDGEFALFCLGYNLKRAINLIGFEKMMAIMEG